jgi:hypothetical protein
VPRDVPTLSDPQRAQIIEVISLWARVHPHRDLPIVGLADGSEYTPMEIARALADSDDPRGSYLLRVFAAGLIPDGTGGPESLDDILADFRRDAARWADRPH